MRFLMMAPIPLKYLQPMQSESDPLMLPREVYRTEQGAFFKPGESTAAITLLCKELCVLAGLGAVIPKSDRDIQNIIAPEDTKAKYVKTKTSDGEVILCDISPESAIPVKKGKGNRLNAEIDREDVKLVPNPKNPKEYLDEIDLEDGVKDPTLYYIVQHKGKNYLTSKMNLVRNNQSGEYVQRRGREHVLLTDDKGLIVVRGQKVPGLLQQAVAPIFTKFPDQARDLDLRTGSKETKTFFEMISFEGFVQSFIAMMLIRTKDGRAADLGESNVLFKMEDKQLLPYLIDFDPEEVMGESSDIFLCGLMGYPHAHKPLSESERLSTLTVIKQIVLQKEGLLSLTEDRLKELDPKVFPSKKQKREEPPSLTKTKALSVVLDGIESFTASEKVRSGQWVLADLLFHVFPAYEKQWVALSKKAGATDMKTAADVGYIDSNPAAAESDSDIEDESDVSDDEENELSDELTATASRSPSPRDRAYGSFAAYSEELDDSEPSAAPSRAGSPVSPAAKKQQSKFNAAAQSSSELEEDSGVESWPDDDF